MKIKSGKLIELIKVAYLSNTPCLVSGVHGTGKSTLLHTAAKEMGIGFIPLNLALLENVDLQGIPTVKDGVTIYNPPVILPRDGKGLLSLEECNRADRSVLSCALLLTSLRQLNSYTLPPGWLPVASVNPSEGYDVNEMDSALLSRFIRVTLEPDVRDWLAWAEKNGVHPSVCRFVRATPNIFDSSDSNPRGWDYASNFLRAYEQSGSSDDGLLTTGICGLVGDALGVAFTQFHLNGEEPLSADNVLRDYDRYRRTVQEWANAKKTDMLNASAHNVLVAIQNVDLSVEIINSQVMQTTLGEFVADLPADIGKRVKQAAKKAGVLP